MQALHYIALRLFRAVCLCSLFLLSANSSSFGDVRFPNPKFPAGIYPSSFATGDFNRDGIQDLAVVNPLNASILLGKPGGGFQAATSVTVGSPIALAIGDLDKDGRLDLVFVTGFLRSVSILLGNGDGTFGEPTSFEAGLSARAVALGDFNGDDNLDVASAGVIRGTFSPGITISLGNGDGTLRPPTGFQTPQVPTILSTMDANMDGRLDLVAAYDQTILIRLGLGDSTFGQDRVLSTQDSVFSFAIADFNADGAPDLAVPNPQFDDISIFANNGEALFELYRRIPAGDAPFFLAAPDLNSDGHPDLVCINTASYDLSVIFLDPDGTPLLETRIPGTSGAVAVASGNFDIDTRIDLVLLDHVDQTTTGEIILLQGMPDGRFGGPIPKLPAGQYSQHMVAGKFNEDELDDIAVFNPADAFTSSLSVFLRQPDGTFAPQTTFPVGGWVSALATGDFNGDARLDLVVLNTIDGNTAIMDGNGDGSFLPPRPIHQYSGSGVAVADLNEDGKLDLAVSGSVGALRILLGRGDGTFTDFALYPATAQTSGIEVADLNGDGHDDVLVASYGVQFGTKGKASLYLGNGNGTFSSPRDFLVGSYPIGFAVGRFNSDSFLDFAVANSGYVSVFLASGAGTFAPEALYDAGFSSQAIRMGDLDGDGHLDLAVANTSGREDVGILLGRGDGTFGSRASFMTEGSPSSLILKDLNLDGRLDIALAIGGSSGSLAIMLNQGPPDSDGDGIVDPLDPCTDSDQDGWGDAGFPQNNCLTDNCPYTPNPSQADSDVDSVGDACDNCPTVQNPDQKDTDHDRLSDACDGCTDTDRDGFGDGGFPWNTCPTDNCPHQSNPLQEDSDTDGRGNVCDSCPADPLNDQDSDGVCGNLDNCPTVPNACQVDRDQDSLGDVCDECIDTDHDGYGDPGYTLNVCETDNCPAVANPDQQDLDQNGLGDACEIGDAPRIRSISIISERLHFSCTGFSVPLCCVDPPNCTCCCLPDVSNTFIVDIDAITVKAQIEDPGGPSDVQSVVVSFRDPPGCSPNVISSGLDLFDSGTADVNPAGGVQLSGDQIAGDSIFTRRFYFATSTPTGSGTCVEDRDRSELGGTLATYFAPFSLDPESVRNMDFLVRAVDQEGQSQISLPIPHGMHGTHRENHVETLPCGPQTGNGGCQAGNPPPSAAAGMDFEGGCSSPVGGAVQLDGTASADSGPVIGGGIQSFEWFDGFGTPDQRLVGLGPTPIVTLSLGIHTITLRVTDTMGATATDQVIVTITDPLISDGDTDGVGDICDGCPSVFDPGQQDLDGDLAGNACDVCTDTDEDGFGDAGFTANTCTLDDCPSIYNPLQEDDDADGQGNSCDNCPLDAFNDSDSDGRCANTDNCVSVYNPGQEDADSDGIGDVCDSCTDLDGDGFGEPGFPQNTCPSDNCPIDDNPSQQDSDEDGSGDACDACPRDALNDGDHDGHCADVDDCPSVANPLQEDLDGDTVGDMCDSCTDWDADGFGNPDYPLNTCANDNCPFSVNPGQQDLDADGLGDPCDNCPEDSANDADNDSYCETYDNCDALANVDQRDSDQDSIGDACDPCTDADGDGAGDPGFPINSCPSDNCPTVANSNQTDSNADGSGDACQPSMSLGSIRAVGPNLLAVSLAASDPQGEVLQGSLVFGQSVARPIVMNDVFLTSGCAAGVLPDDVPGEGIAFAFGSVGTPFLFDLDSVLGCIDGVADFEMAFGGCETAEEEFATTISLEGQVPPVRLCVRRVGQASTSVNLYVEGLDSETLQGSLESPFASALRIDFDAGLPRRSDISALQAGTIYRLVVSLTDGNTVPLSLETPIDYHGETTLLINSPPRAKIAPQSPAECSGPAGTPILLDGSASTDPDSVAGSDSDIVSFDWFVDFGSPAERQLGSGESLTVTLPLGPHAVTLRTRDSQGEEATDASVLEVRDTLPPILSCPAGPESECTSPQGAPVALLASAEDLCDGVAPVHNNRNDLGGDASGVYPLGRTPVGFYSEDRSGNRTDCTTEVHIQDTTPPVLLAEGVPRLLWPPNHQLMNVNVVLQAADACGTTTTTLAGVESDEIDDAPGSGDGNTMGDVRDVAVGAMDTHFQLRAERQADGPGRRYTAHYESRDAAGNLGSSEVVISVPHDQGGTIDPLDISASQDGGDTIWHWSSVPEATSYTLIRGLVGSIRELPEVIDVGTVTCTELNSSGAIIVSRDAVQPGPGQVFFYLASYGDPSVVSYGAPSAVKPRQANLGTCSTSSTLSTTQTHPPFVERSVTQ